MNAKEYQSGFLKGSDIPNEGADSKILKVGTEQVFKNERIVLTLEGLDRQLIVAGKNLDFLIQELGQETENWTGAGVRLEPVMQEVDGVEKKVIRIRNAIKAE